MEKVGGLPAGVRQITIGPDVGCAAARETVHCWGAARWARFDEHGSPHSTDVPGYMSNPLHAVSIEGPQVPIASLTVGGETGGIVTTDGRVFFFGSNDLTENGATAPSRYCGLDTQCPDTDLRRSRVAVTRGRSPTAKTRTRNRVHPRRRRHGVVLGLQRVPSRHPSERRRASRTDGFSRRPCRDETYAAPRSRYRQRSVALRNGSTSASKSGAARTGAGGRTWTVS